MNLFPIEPRPADDLLLSGLSVIEQGMAAGAGRIVALLSGGHDSTCASHIASRHPRFDGEVHHIDTGIGAEDNRRHVDSLCEQMGWRLVVHRSPFTFERFVRLFGFPGPGRHQWVYNRIKDRCVRKIVKAGPTALVTGCRSEESTRRMGHVDPMQVGEVGRKTGRVREKNRVWVAPCHDWSVQEQQAYMLEHDLPHNLVKKRLGVSGECFCGAFASPGELERVRFFVPDVAQKIDRLAVIARECGTHDKWGTRPPDQKGLLTVRSGKLCSSCDFKAQAAGLLFEP